MGDFSRLSVYRNAAVLADDLRELVLGWSSFDRWTVGAQLIRSADSIGANIAEAYGRHGGDQVRFLYIARGSVHETEHWIDVARARGLLEGALPCRVRKVGRMLNGLINSHRTR